MVVISILYGLDSKEGNKRAGDQLTPMALMVQQVTFSDLVYDQKGDAVQNTDLR